MANIETSFIPEQGGTYQYGARRSYAATIFAVFITVIAIGATAYVWWALRAEKRKVDAYAAALQSTEKNFDLDKIATLAQLDKRINLAREIFNKHSMPSLVIDYLSDHTVSSIRWTQFSYKKMVADAKASPEGVPAGDTLELTGEAIGYGALYQQLAHFRAQNRVILYTELSSFHIDPRTGVVAIAMRLVLRPTYATFATVRERAAASEAPVAAPAPAAAPAAAPVIITPPTQVTPVAPKPATTTPAQTSPSTTTKPAVAPITKPAVTPVGQ
ncbi:MAG TPA: hypothetical protein VJ579_04860 [Candidatus Paceibacterota bacterium]|nr:hypothetical protein [Candidatus Paceibacterota bacterium]